VDPAQRTASLKNANRIRLERAELKRGIKAGNLTASATLAGEPPDWLERMQVEHVVLATHRFPRHCFHQMMLEIPAGLGLRVGELTSRQRQALAEMLRKWEREAERRQAKREAREAAA
jgi:hypothetical protein